MAKKMAKIISFISSKGGVGKSVLLLTLSGIYSIMKKKVLILDFDLSSGGVGVSLNIDNSKTIYNMVDDLNNGRYKAFNNYITKYNDYIDVMISPIDPRQANKIEIKDIETILSLGCYDYDVVLVDTNHSLTNYNLMIMDKSDYSLLIVTNDPIDLKNSRSLISIFSDIEKDNYKVILNSSRDLDRDFLTMFDIKNIIQANVDYTISKSFHIKNIDKRTLNGEIISLNNKLRRRKKKDIDKLINLASELITERSGDING